MAEEALYLDPDRGHFTTIRLTDHSGTHFHVGCRIKEAVIFNFLSDLRYAVVGYTIEFWDQDMLAPHEGGAPTVFIPKNRPSVTKLYFRMKNSNTPRMLYIEDAIINDFLNKKVQADPVSLLSYAQEAAEQTVSIGDFRALEGTPYSYREAVHITRLTTTATTPLAVESEGLRFTWKRTTDETPGVDAQVTDYPFTKLRDCYDKIKETIESGV